MTADDPYGLADYVEMSPPLEPERFETWRRARPAQVPAPRRINLVSAASFAGLDVPQRSWVVPDLVPDRTVTLLPGDGGVGKSLLAMQLAVAITTGTDWIGTMPVSGPVIYLGAEDELDEMHRRLVDITASRDIAMSDLGDLHLLALVGEDAVLASPDFGGAMAATSLWYALESKLASIRPRLLVLDNSADVFGGNEISRAQVRQFVGLIRAMAVRHETAVLLLSHPSLTGLASGTGTSGSTAWSNSARARLYLEKPKTEDGSQPDPDVRLLRVVKANYSAVGGETRLRWTAGVFRLDGAGPSGFDRAAKDQRAEQVFVDLLTRLQRQGRHVSHQRSNTFAPTVFAKEPDNGGFGKGPFEAAMNRLFKAEKIRVEQHGPASRLRSHIVVV